MSKTEKASTKTKRVASSNDFFDRANAFISKNERGLFWTFFVLNLIFGLLLFDLKVSEGGDDSSYIVRALRLLRDGTYPTFQGPLYPLFLCIPVKMFGLNLFAVKMTSFFFMIGNLFFMHRIYKDHIPKFVLYIALLFTATNCYLLTYGSLTYSEPIYMFLQILFFAFFFKHFINPEEPVFDIKKDWWKYLFVGFMILILTLTRKLGIFMVIVCALYFLTQKQWKQMAATIVSSGFWYMLYDKVIQYSVLGLDPEQLAVQQNRLLHKDPYNFGKGKEDFWGFIGRGVDNANQFLSYHLYKFMGFRPDVVTQEEKDLPILTIFTVAIMILALVIVFKKNKHLLFTSIYVLVMAGITFLLIHARWNQERMVLIYLPYFVMLVMALMYYFLKSEKRKGLQFVSVILAGIFFFSSIGRTWSHSKDQFKDFRKNMRGDVYAGYTPDWENFLRMSEWASQNIPEENLIASRKPTMSTIYGGGREFYGIYRIETQDPDSLVDELIRREVDYIIMASLRKIPTKKTQYTVNTIQRWLYYMAQKYPQIAQQVHVVGQSEPAYLFKMNYPPERVKIVQDRLAAEANQ